ncbi:MAG: response regulator, partial [Anaerolineales bacterium]
MAIRVLLADDHAVVRDGLKALLESQDDIEVVGVAGDGISAVQECRRIIPDVVVMDIAMPLLNGIDATMEILHDNDKIGVIFLSMYASQEHILRALQVGARGYLLKESAGNEVIQAIRSVAQGKRYMSSGVAELMVK